MSCRLSDYPAGKKPALIDGSRILVRVSIYLAKFWDNPKCLRLETGRIMGLNVDDEEGSQEGSYPVSFFILLRLLLHWKPYAL